MALTWQWRLHSSGFRTQTCSRFSIGTWYRAVFGERYPVHSGTPSNTKASVYFNDLDALHSIPTLSRVPFRDLDRILYVFDKDHNGTL